VKAPEAKLLEFIRKSPQFVIPLYQRTYSWTEKECGQLWSDIIRAGSNDEVAVHFVGSIVYIETGLGTVTHQSPLLVIDGQQRLTTVTLLLGALANRLAERDESDPEPLDGFSARKLRNYYLLNPEETGERHFKLLLSQTDKNSLNAIVAARDQPAESSLRVTQNFELFEKLIASCQDDLVPVCSGLAKLVVVDIALNRDYDNPQLIFESMNSTGRELSQADLIRNYVLMGLETELQTSLYEHYWRPMEVEFGQEAYGSHFDSFMRHYLTVKTGAIPRINEVYDAFKAHARTPSVEAAGVEALVRDVRAFSRYFCAMALGAETDPDLKLVFQDLSELRVDVAFPFLLEMYHDYATGALSRTEFLASVRLVEAYVFRRAICAIPTNSLNLTFANFSKVLKKDRYIESVQAHFLLLPSYRRFPTDEEFQRDLQTRDLYNFPRRSYWLRRLENHGRKERVSVGEYTIEHILPQNPNLSSAWKAALGPGWERVQHTWLHTLGNLTLTAYNSEYSDLPFSRKRDMQGGFKESPLHLNAGLGQLDEWNEDAILTRAEKLADVATDVWAPPFLPDDVLDAYRSSPAATTYSISHHPYLSEGSSMYGSLVPELFDALRKEVLALDPCVTEEFLKLYVAYKAETNFVDVVPQAKRLRLTLNMAFNELDDPRGVSRDVSGLGRWGNGEVEVSLDSFDQLPYIMGLIRQSLERQLGDAAAGS
jgi:uncharacterized protein with ParB-like and HNH nuclease domain/predicted transport protein